MSSTSSLSLQPTVVVVLVTTSSEAEATQIARHLVTANLAACVSITSPIRSIYCWQGEIQDEYEWQLVIKTTLSQWDSLEAEILRLHSYEVPEIIAIPIVAGSAAYLQWLGAQVGDMRAG